MRNLFIYILAFIALVFAFPQQGKSDAKGEDAKGADAKGADTEGADTKGADPTGSGNEYYYYYDEEANATATDAPEATMASAGGPTQTA